MTVPPGHLGGVGREQQTIGIVEVTKSKSLIAVPLLVSVVMLAGAYAELVLSCRRVHLPSA